MQSSQGPLELGRAPAAAPWPWQGWHSPEGGGAEEGAGGFQRPVRSVWR